MPESAIYRFYRFIRYPLPYKLWRKLPRVATHKNEYIGGELWLTPRPKTFDIFLKLDGWSPPKPAENAFRSHPIQVSISPLTDGDWPELAEVYHSAFAYLQPLWSWNDHAAATASRAVMRSTRRGDDGPLLANACFVARAKLDWGKETDEPSAVGGAIVTLAPVSRLWGVPAEDAVVHPTDPDQKVLPHLTWIFVSHLQQHSGIGTLLLEDVIGALKNSGYRTLVSTVSTENAQSMQWHWRNGFQMPPNRLSFKQAVRATP
jgi:ribosomal protein S18 acetylase RimI-like enzyme